jgi:hypothetical protein
LQQKEKERRLTMKKVLVGVSSETTDLWPVIYALNLAKRVKMRLFVLLVLDPRERRLNKEKYPVDESSIKMRLEALLSEGRSWGIPIDYHIATGSYKEELIQLIQNKEISLVVLAMPTAAPKGSSEGIHDILDEIKLRTACDIEIVHPRGSVQEK